MDKRSVSFIDELRPGDGSSAALSDGMGENYRSVLNKARHKLLAQSPKPNLSPKFVNDELSQKIMLLQDILYELPELENTLANSIYGAKHEHKKSISAKILRILFLLVFLVLVYSSIFVLGLTVSSYLLSPIPLTGTLMANYVDKNVENDLQKIILIEPGTVSDRVKVRGNFKVAYNVLNNTPFSGALSIHMDVNYLPQSGLKTSNAECFGGAADSFADEHRYKNVKNGALDFFAKTEYSYEDGTNRDEVLKKKRFGSLITLEKVIGEKDMEDKSLTVLEATPYNAFLAHKLVGNKVEIIPKIRRGYNKVVILVTLETELDPMEKSGEEELVARSMLEDCRVNGFLTLKFDASLQKFDTMLFSGNMLPTSFLPVSVPCSVSADEATLDRMSSAAADQRVLYNRQQYILKKLNTVLNM